MQCSSYSITVPKRIMALHSSTLLLQVENSKESLNEQPETIILTRYFFLLLLHSFFSFSICPDSKRGFLRVSLPNLLTLRVASSHLRKITITPETKLLSQLIL